jgi:hypothetical protein
LERHVEGLVPQLTLPGLHCHLRVGRSHHGPSGCSSQQAADPTVWVADVGLLRRQPEGVLERSLTALNLPQPAHCFDIVDFLLDQRVRH